MVFAAPAGIAVGAGKGLLANAEIGLGRVEDKPVGGDLGIGVVGKIDPRAGFEGGAPIHKIPGRLDDHLIMDKRIELRYIMAGPDPAVGANNLLDYDW